MADIFFGKFSELISIKTENYKIIEKNEQNKIPPKNKPINKIVLISSALIIVGIILYYIN